MYIRRRFERGVAASAAMSCNGLRTDRATRVMNDWNDAERRVERAAELYEQRKLQEAVDELRAAIAINPYNSGWFFNLGLTLDELDRADEAIDAYKQALEIDPHDLQTMSRLGMDQHRV